MQAESSPSVHDGPVTSVDWQWTRSPRQPIVSIKRLWPPGPREAAQTRTVEQRRLDNEAACDEQAETGAAEEGALGRDTSTAGTPGAARETGRPLLNFASHLGERIATWKGGRYATAYAGEEGASDGLAGGTIIRGSSGKRSRTLVGHGEG